MINVTLDMNCIIDLEEARESSPYIKGLIQLHNDGKVNLRVVAVGASERKPDGTYAANFAEFTEKISDIGLGHVELLKPLGYRGMAFFDWCVLGGEELTNLERRIHEILFPNIEFAYRDFCAERGFDSSDGEIDPHWRNPKCDVLALWSHIYHGGGVFVTRDGNFLGPTKRPKLISLGGGDILKPKDAVRELTDTESSI